MTKELAQKLFDRFEFYRPHLPMTVNLMCFGFECGDGWFQLIWDLSEKLEELEKKKLESIPSNEIAKEELLDSNEHKFNVVQVKEKFGTLRFYADNASNEQYDLINEAEKLSETTCEVCGKKGQLRGNGWYYVACDEHTNKEDRE